MNTDETKCNCLSVCCHFGIAGQHHYEDFMIFGETIGYQVHDLTKLQECKNEVSSIRANVYNCNRSVDNIRQTKRNMRSATCVSFFLTPFFLLQGLTLVQVPHWWDRSSKQPIIVIIIIIIVMLIVCTSALFDYLHDLVINYQLPVLLLLCIWYALTCQSRCQLVHIRSLPNQKHDNKVQIMALNRIS